MRRNPEPAPGAHRRGRRWPQPPRSATRDSPSAGLPRCWRGCRSPYPATRWTACAPGAMTATTRGLRHRSRRLRRGHRCRRRAHGPPPHGRGRRPNPRFLAEKIVDPEALLMGKTAENLHDRFPQLTKERADAYAVASQEKTAKAYADGKIQPDLVPVAIRYRRARLGPGHRRRAASPRHLDGVPGGPEDPVPPARPGDRRQRRRPQRRRHGRSSWPLRRSLTNWA
jgi:hypothetical protein